ncbi:MAG: dTMP kinase [Candidatus Sulfotelmatobacter sp.]
MNSGVVESMSGTRARGKKPFLITFSGIDGAGKTTQIEELSAYLQGQGLRVLRLSFWDDVAVWRSLRAKAGEGAARLHRKRGRADAAFGARNHKHIRKWYLTAARSVLYLLDVLSLRRVLPSQRVGMADVVIFDRYIYDQIVNIDSHLSSTRAYSCFLLKYTPRPDMAFILDASPDAAFARKPEYPLEFVYRNRQSFLDLHKLDRNLVILSAGNIEETQKQIQEHLRRQLFTAEMGKTAESNEKSTVAVRQSSCRVRNEPTTTV